MQTISRVKFNEYVVYVGCATTRRFTSASLPQHLCTSFPPYFDCATRSTHAPVARLHSHLIMLTWALRDCILGTQPEPLNIIDSPALTEESDRTPRSPDSLNGIPCQRRITSNYHQQSRTPQPWPPIAAAPSASCVSCVILRSAACTQPNATIFAEHAVRPSKVQQFTLRMQLRCLFGPRPITIALSPLLNSRSAMPCIPKRAMTSEHEDHNFTNRSTIFDTSTSQS